MNTINANERRSLAIHEAPHSVSLLMPSHRAGVETQQDPVRLRNLVVRAERELIERGVGAVEARNRLAEARSLVEDAAFWRERQAGLAVFIGDDLFRVHRLPIEPLESVHVGKWFHLRSLLSAAPGDERFYLLALSQRSVRLFRMGRYRIEPVQLPRGTPCTIEDLTVYDDTERQLQWHSRAQPVGVANIRAAMFHGQGVGTDEAQEKKRISEFCHGVAHGVKRALATAHDPLILVAAEPLASLYRQANGYAGLVKAGAKGNPDGLRPEELHDRAWPIVQHVIDERVDAARRRCEAALGTGGATCDPGRLLSAVHHGQIETLFVSQTDRLWGIFEPDQGNGGWRLELHGQRRPSDEDLLDLATARAISSGATVIPLPNQSSGTPGAPGSRGTPVFPGGGSAAAVFRYVPVP